MQFNFETAAVYMLKHLAVDQRRETIYLVKLLIIV